MTFKPGIPSQQEADFNNPEEHFVWCLRNMPTFAGIGAVTPAEAVATAGA
ncbi:DUF2744 domain-containing protein, partial [Mycobacteroides abscessus subsp. massiliense]